MTEEKSQVPVGTLIWVQDAEQSWVCGELQSRESNEDGTFVFKVRRKDNAEVVDVKSASADLTSAEEMKLCNTFEDGGALHEVWDLTRLTHLHEPAVLQALCDRYDKNEIYTNTGPILLAVNPFKDLSETLYKDTILERYYTNGLLRSQNLEPEPLGPHIFATGDAAYRSLVDSGDAMTGKDKLNQSILVSGESGAGKTMSTKFIMRYLATVACEENSSESKQIADMVLESNPILEAFGNARTTRNDNSSRFGKFIEMQFNMMGKLVGARIKTYLLEKVRLAKQGEGERNFHIFYELVKGADEEERGRWLLPELEECGMTNISNCFDREDGVADDQSFLKVKRAMKIMGFTDEEKEQVMGTVSGVMNLSIVKFKQKTSEDDSAINVEDAGTVAALEKVGKLLNLDSSEVESALCLRKTQVGKEEFTNALSVTEASDARDALIKTVYSRMFDWIVRRVNQSIENQAKQLNFIGVLDIFGFEVFVHNSFEQLCINYANETLQQQFNQFVFKLEQIEYEKENITWSFIDFPDNQETLSLIDGKPIGLLSLLDDQCMYPKGSDEKLARQFYEKLEGKSEVFSASSKEKVNNMFAVHHYAGKVVYDALGFCEKNKDQLFQEALDLMQSTKSDLLGTLFPKGEMASTTASKSKALQAVTVGNQFKSQLAQLLDVIKSTAPHYVRCLKPNDRAAQGDIVRVRLVDQLRYGGVLEAVKVARAGYPVRMPLPDFSRRYQFLLEEKTSSDFDKKMGKQIVESCGFEKMEHYQIGVTKMFLRKAVYERLEERRGTLRRKRAIMIQRNVRSYHHRQLFATMKSSAMTVQRFVRVSNAKRRLLQLRRENAALRLQTFTRSSLAKASFNKLRSSVVLLQAFSRGQAGRKVALTLRQHLAVTRAAAAWRKFVEMKAYRSFRSAVVSVQCASRSRAAKKVYKTLRTEARQVGNLQGKLQALQAKVLALQTELDQVKSAHQEEVERREDAESQVQTLMKMNSESVLSEPTNNDEPNPAMLALEEENNKLRQQLEEAQEADTPSKMAYWKHQMNSAEEETSEIHMNGTEQTTTSVVDNSAELQSELKRLKELIAKRDEQISELQTKAVDLEQFESLRELCVKQQDQIEDLLKENTSGATQPNPNDDSSVTELATKLKALEQERIELVDTKSRQDIEIRQLKERLEQQSESKDIKIEEYKMESDSVTFSGDGDVNELRRTIEMFAAENKDLKEALVKEKEATTSKIISECEAANLANELENEANTLRNELASLRQDLAAKNEANTSMSKKCKTLEAKMVAMETLAEQASGVKIALAKRLEELILENRSNSSTVATLKDKVNFYKDANKLLQDDLKETRRQLKQQMSSR